MIKRLVSIALLFVWLFNVLNAYIPVSSAELHQHKRNVARDVHKAVLGPAIYFAFDCHEAIDWTSWNREFTLGNEHYDVLQLRTSVAGKVIVKAVRDVVEKSLIEKSKEEKRKLHHKNHPFKTKIKKLSVPYFFFGNKQKPAHASQTRFIASEWGSCAFTSREDNSVPTPPPNKFC